MAKSKNNKKKATEKKTADNAQKPDQNQLPQNILPVGERVEEDKNIYILQSVYHEIHKFTADKKVNEAGGMLVGTVIEEFGKMNILINGFIEAKYCEATPTTLKFTHETWERCHKEMEKKYPDQKILGWIHTHPNFGIFLSEYDMFIQSNFFSEPYEVAYVVDPIQDIEGFYFWINDKIERCKGFYIYDKTGKKISPIRKQEAEEPVEKAEQVQSNPKTRAVIGVLCAAVLIMAAFIVFLNNRVNTLEQHFSELVNTYNQFVMQFNYAVQALPYRDVTPSAEDAVPPETTTQTQNDLNRPADRTVSQPTEEGTVK